MNFLKEFETRFTESHNTQVVNSAPSNQDTGTDQSTEPKPTFFEFARNELHKLGLNLYSDDKYQTWIVRYRGTKVGLNFDNEVVRYGRSLIVDAVTHETLMVAPPKSWKYEDFRKDYPDVSKVHVEDFPTGPMLNIFWHNDKWVMSTRSYVGAENNFRSTKSFKTLFEECFSSATGLTFEQAAEHFDKNLTYSWVIQHPDFLDVTRPMEPVLYLVEVRDRQNEHRLSNLSVVESKFQQKDGWKVKFPKRHNFQTWEEVDNFVGEQTCAEQGLVFRCDGKRSKVRNLDFLNARILLGNHSKPLEMYTENRQNKTMKQFLGYFPEFGPEFHALEHYVEQMAIDIHGYYLAANTRQKADRIGFKDEIPQSFQTACFNIHQAYWSSGADVKSRKPVRLETVRNYIDSIPHMYLANMIYSRKEEQKNTSSKLEAVEKMSQATQDHHQKHYNSKRTYTEQSRQRQIPDQSHQRQVPDQSHARPVPDLNPHSYANVAKSVPVPTPVPVSCDEESHGN
jgi:hypothetical protein